MSLFDWLYPPVCVGCKKRGSVFCESCLLKIRQQYEHVHRCSRCDTPLTHGECTVCQVLACDIEGIQIYGSYSHPLSTAIKHMKFHHRSYYANIMGQLLADLINQKSTVQADILVTVPMQHDKERQRGYNPTVLLAKSMANLLHVPVMPKLVIRTRQAPSQHMLPKTQRLNNVAGLFACDSTFVHGKRVIIVDDVLTTGATMRAMADALHIAGASKIWGIALAHPTNKELRYNA